MRAGLGRRGLGERRTMGAAGSMARPLSSTRQATSSAIPFSFSASVRPHCRRPKVRGSASSNLLRARPRGRPEWHRPKAWHLPGLTRCASMLRLAPAAVAPVPAVLPACALVCVPAGLGLTLRRLRSGRFPHGRQVCISVDCRARRSGV